MTLQPFIPFPPTRLGCHYGGRLYKPDEKIYESATIHECLYSLICDGDDRLRTDWEPGCPRTTPPPTLSTPRFGCDISGKYYLPGEQIYSGSEGGQGNWCYVSRCKFFGEVQVAHYHCLTTVGRTPATILPPIIHVG
jgi:hypothetical protein